MELSMNTNRPNPRPVRIHQCPGGGGVQEMPAILGGNLDRRMGNRLKKRLITVALAALAGSASAATAPLSAEFTTTNASFQWPGWGGASYALEQCPDLSFTNQVQSRYFLGDGGFLSDVSPLPDQDAGFWRVRSLGPSNGVCVATSGEYAGKLVRYDDAGDPVLLQAFGVNYSTAFTRYIDDVNNTNFIAGFEYLRDHHIPVARVQAAGFWPINWNLYFTDRDEYFQRLDYFIAQAEYYGVGLILDCFWANYTLGELVDDAVVAGYLIPGVDFVPVDPLNLDEFGNPTYDEYKRAMGRPDSGSNAFIALYTRELVERYGRSPAIWGWEFGNEYNLNVDHPNVPKNRDRPGAANTQGMTLANSNTNLVELPAWTGPDDLVRADVWVAKENFANTVRSIDTWRLIMGGDSIPRVGAYHSWTAHTWGKDSRAELAQVLPVDNPAPMDTVTVHIYPGKPDSDPEIYFMYDDPVTNQWVTGQYKELMDYFVAESAVLGRPLIVGEWGAIGTGTTDDEKTTFHRYMQALIDSGVQLSLLWNFDGTNPGQVEEWYVNPGTPKEYQLTNEDPDLWDLEQANLFFQD